MQDIEIRRLTMGDETLERRILGGHPALHMCLLTSKLLEAKRLLDEYSRYISLE